MQVLWNVCLVSLVPSDKRKRKTSKRCRKKKVALTVLDGGKAA